MNAPVVAGDVIAEKYRVDRVLGEGAMAMVVGASHLSQPQQVAIKLLLDERRRGAAERLLEEARAAALLRGEHVVRVLDAGLLGSGVPYVVMEHVEGRDLAEVLRERRTLDIPEALDYVLQACVAVAEAHAAGIVHRGLEPASLLLVEAPDGSTVLKVRDFGLWEELSDARAGDPGAPGSPGELPRAALYASPEQVRRSDEVYASADLWSLGAILYHLLTGQPPFEATSLADLSLRVAGADPGLPSAIRGDIPPAVERILLCCLEKDPERRPANVAELAIALAPLAPVASQGHAERAARILGATLPPRPRASLPTIGLGLNAGPLSSGPRSAPQSGPRSGPRSAPLSGPRSGPRSAPPPPSGPRSYESVVPSAPAPSIAAEHAPPDRGARRARVGLIAAIASLIAILAIVAARAASPGERRDDGHDRPASAAPPAAPGGAASLPAAPP
ncbi:protein kinase domain-containing protein [Sorangium sp. So ce131]|uniref:serine/threonine-protein kinase n=1 Tax=Sorangium sp. So ce131 TaxID=3133282 RepID=UPI003F604ABB